MFDKLIDFLVDVIDAFRFWQVVQPYERGLGITLGKHVRVLEPGFYFIWPFYIEKVITDNVVPKTSNLKEQILTTKDGETVSLGIVIVWRITDIRRATLEVEHADSVMADVVSGQLGKAVEQASWDDVRQPQFIRKLRDSCRRYAAEWGIDVQSVRFTDKSRCRGVFRLVGDSYRMTEVSPP